MRGAKRVSLRRRKPKKVRPIVGFRCPPDIKEYLDVESGKPNRDQTEVIISALELDRDLDLKLRPNIEHIEAYAASNSLDMDEQLAEILVRLIRGGLEAQGKARKN